MMQGNDKAIKYIESLIKDLSPAANIKHYDDTSMQNYCFRVTTDKVVVIKFPVENMEDLESLMAKPEEDSRCPSFRSAIDFQIYISLGKEGVTRPDFKISQKLLEEKRDWRTGVDVNVSWDKDIDVPFYEGLQKIYGFLIREYSDDFGSPKIKEDKQIISDLIRYYTEKRTFGISGATEQNLQYLKAALVAEVIALETEKYKKKPLLKRFQQGIDSKIYSIVEQLRSGVLMDIKLPDCIYEYSTWAQRDSATALLVGGIAPFASNKIVFLAHPFKDKNLRDKVESELKRIGFELKEGKVDDCGYISDDILEKIKLSGFFMALITPVKEFKGGKFSTSSWVLMEIGAAIAYGRKALLLADKTVDASEYEGKLQRDCQHEVFDATDFDAKLIKTLERIQKEFKKFVN